MTMRPHHIPIVLTVLNGDEKGRIIVVENHAPATIGRGEGAAIQLSASDSRLSRRHAELERSGVEWAVVQLSTGTNPLRVNAIPGGRFVLADGDEIQLGDTRLRVSLGVERALAPKCATCGADLSLVANSDKKALELMDVATYCCLAHIPIDSGIPLRSVGKYRLCAALGRGGAGTVYKAYDTETGRVVALKQLNDVHNIDQIRRFDQEMSELRDLRHTNVVRFIDCGVDGDGRPFLITEFVPNGNLTHLLQRYGQKVPIAMAKDLIVQVLDGLRFLHGRNVIHRDLKPENVLLRDEELQNGGRNVTAKLADFGLLKKLNGLKLTRPNDACGSFEFMPPEQPTEFSRLRVEADIYAVGATLYFLLSGSVPIDLPFGADDLEMVRRVMYADRVPIRERVPSLPLRLATVIDKACSKQVSDRFPSADAFQAALSQAV